jgi:hypothetical protein
MEYAASLVKQQVNMKMYMSGDLCCTELTREMKIGEPLLLDDADDIKILLAKTNQPTVVTKQNGTIVIYVPLS